MTVNQEAHIIISV